MSDKPEALRLADALEADPCEDECMQAAALLDRQHAEIERLRAENERLRAEIERLRAERDALRALLIRIRSWDHLRWASDGPFWIREIDAALAAREAK